MLPRLAVSGTVLLLLGASVFPAAAQVSDEGPGETQEVGSDPGLESATAARTNRETFRIPAVRVPRGPVVDGNLDDDVWLHAPVIDEFVQQEPREGEPATERTEVRLLHDGENLYIGVRAFDAAPERIVATEMRRDGGQILNEDNFQIILDTFMDSRSAYMFVVSPLGALLDQQVFQEGQGSARGASSNINRDWDGVWEAAARRTPEGWSAEIRIPMVTLRFPEGEPQSWGINFMRHIPHKNETVFWAPVPRAFGLTRVSLAGALTGLEGLERGRDLRIKPYFLGGGRQERVDGIGDRSSRGDVGVDLRYGLTPSLNLDVTVNTDFAQAEADDERVNLTRFPLFFPEKREFFLENAGQFNVGTTASLGRIADLFFSRRIGLTQTGGQVPILAGARLTGKVGANNVALMNIQTDDATDRPGENFLVARYSRDVLDRSRVGALVINKQATAGGHYNRTVAADATFALGPSLTLNGFLARTATPGVSSDEMGGHFRAGWLNRDWNVYVEHTDLRDNFNPEVGFVPRVGIRTSKVHFERTPRPGRWNIRVLEPMWNVTYTTDQTGRMVSRQYHNMLGVRFMSNAYLILWHNRYFERLDQSFRVGGDVTIDPGDYEFQDWRVSFSSDPSRRLSYNVAYEPQTFYDGDRTDLSARLSARVTPQLATSVRYSRNDLDLPAGGFVAQVGSFQVDYALSPALSVRTLTQYNSLNEQWSTSARLRYIYRPGSDLYVVYDEVRRDVAGIPTASEFRDRQLIIKLTYLLSL